MHKVNDEFRMKNSELKVFLCGDIIQDYLSKCKLKIGEKYVTI